MVSYGLFDRSLGNNQKKVDKTFYSLELVFLHTAYCQQFWDGEYKNEEVVFSDCISHYLSHSLARPDMQPKTEKHTCSKPVSNGGMTYPPVVLKEKKKKLLKL